MDGKSKRELQVAFLKQELEQLNVEYAKQYEQLEQLDSKRGKVRHKILELMQEDNPELADKQYEEFLLYVVEEDIQHWPDWKKEKYNEEIAICTGATKF